MSAHLLFTLGTALVVGCAILAAYGFRGRVSTIGVDLGTTFSVVGVNKNGVVYIVEDEFQRKLFPSIVSFGHNGDIFVAHDALPLLESHPHNTIFNSKRFIGKNWEDKSVQEYGKSHPYKVVKCNDSVSNHSTVGFEIDLDYPEKAKRIVSPETIGTEILKHLLKVTGKYLGYNQVNKAVIAVPAKFSSKQRIATAEAYKQAGLKVVRVIEEPTAAAVAYGLHKKENVQHILVYDFGGGTLDVSLLYVAEGSVQVYATDGDENLGGSDLDMCLYDFITSEISSKYEFNWEDLENEQHLNDENVDSELTYRGVDICLPATIRQIAEKVKIQLSSSPSVEFNCYLPIKNTELHKYHLVSINATVNQFHDTCQHVFKRSILPVSRLLEELNMQPDSIDEIVLVGGTTRIPLIKQLLREFFNRVDLNDKIDPDVTVAYGAAAIVD